MSLGLDVDVVEGVGAFVRGSKGRTYLVHRPLEHGTLACTCPDWFCHGPGHRCKHIRKVVEYWAAHRGH
jgi:hypothetical protein